MGRCDFGTIMPLPRSSDWVSEFANKQRSFSMTIALFVRKPSMSQNVHSAGATEAD